MRVLLAVLALAVACKADDEYDTIVAAFSSVGSAATASWTTDGYSYATQDCTNEGVTNADQDQMDRWEDVYTNEAIELVLLNWFYASATSTLTFSEYVSNFFNGPEGMNCGSTAPSVGCESMSECDDVNHPAGYFILNSFVAVHTMLYNFFDAFTTAESDMSTEIGLFSSTFAEIEDVQAEIDQILNVIGLGYALAVAPVWNKFLKEMPAFKSSTAANWLGTAKDSVNAIVSNGITIIKTTGAWANTQNNQNLLSYYMGQMIESWETGVSDTNEQLFNGSEASIANLYRLIDEGKVMEETSSAGTMDITGYIEQALYPILIPYAWSLSNENSHPFIVDTGYDCSDTYPDYFHDYLTQDTADAVSVCYNDNLYYLLDARNCQVDCSADISMHSSVCTPTKFSVPLGVDSMDGDAWGGITVENLTISAVNGYVNNGNANGWALLNPQTAADMDEIWNSGVNAGGVVQIPVCDLGTAYTNWVTCDIDQDNYPCQSLT